MTEKPDPAPCIGRLNITVASPPEPALLRSAIEAAVQGRPGYSGPEGAVGEVVARALQAHRRGEPAQGR